MATPASTHRPALFYWSAVPGAQFYCSAVLLFYWSTVPGVQFYCSGVLLFYCSTATAVPGELHMGPVCPE